jgi:hypothetical protein
VKVIGRQKIGTTTLDVVAFILDFRRIVESDGVQSECNISVVELGLRCVQKAKCFLQTVASWLSENGVSTVLLVSNVPVRFLKAVLC